MCLVTICHQSPDLCVNLLRRRGRSDVGKFHESLLVGAERFAWSTKLVQSMAYTAKG